MPDPPNESMLSSEILKQRKPKRNIFHFLHTYRLVGDVKVVQFCMPATYQDWACVHPGCNHIIRKGILNPPTRRVYESRSKVVIENS